MELKDFIEESMYSKEPVDLSSLYKNQSRNDFSRAYRKGFWRAVFSWIRKSNNELLPFDEVMQHVPVRGQHYQGIQQIETARIIGSVNRYQDFDRVFLPRQTHTRNRWESINSAYFQDVILPPIEVYQVDNVYFVKDGNHRVSVALERGQAFMDAYVIKIDIAGKLDENTNINDLILAHEYADFLVRSKLGKVEPEVDFRCSIPGQYDRLLQHISVHRWFMGENLHRPVSEEEACASWYQKVYSPVIKMIRQHNIMKDFPQRTETDLYLWIIEHRWYMTEDRHRKVSLESAAKHYARRFSDRPFRRLRLFWHWLKKRVRKFIKAKTT